MALVPFAAPVARPRRTTPDAVKEAFTKIEQMLGGREALIEVLASADLSDELNEVLCAIGDPTLSNISLAEICLKQNILPGHLLSVYQTALIRNVQITALTRVASKIPLVVEEIARTALPHDEPCPRCDGAMKIELKAKPTKDNPAPESVLMECYRCRGRGTVEVPGLESQQDRLLSLAKLVERGGGFSVAVQQVNNVSGSASRAIVADTPLGALQQAVAEVLKGSRRRLPPPTPAPDGRAVPPAEADPSVVDATVVEEPADAV